MKKPTAVSHLLEQGEGMLQRLRAGAADADRVAGTLKRVLPAELAAEVFSASLRGTTLTAFVRTAAWGTRLRYVAPKLMGKLADELGAPVEEFKVKIRGNAPRRGLSPSAKGP